MPLQPPAHPSPLCLSWPLHHPDLGAGHMESIRTGQRSCEIALKVRYWWWTISFFSSFFYRGLSVSLNIHRIHFSYLPAALACTLQGADERGHSGRNLICGSSDRYLKSSPSLMLSVTVAHSVPCSPASLRLFSSLPLAGLPSSGQHRNYMVFTGTLPHPWNLGTIFGVGKNLCRHVPTENKTIIFLSVNVSIKCRKCHIFMFHEPFSIRSPLYYFFNIKS